ncbi:MAG: hypothetical protein ACLUE1_01980 [Adlercreutzia equolifaciens]
MIDIALVTFLPMFVMQGAGVAAGIVCCLIAVAMLVATAFLYGWRNNQGVKVFPKGKKA